MIIKLKAEIARNPLKCENQLLNIYMVIILNTSANMKSKLLTKLNKNLSIPRINQNEKKLHRNE